MKKKKKSQIGCRVAAGVMDVFGVAAAALAIVVLLLMMGSLFSWLRQDLAMTFADISDNLTAAVVVGKRAGSGRFWRTAQRAFPAKYRNPQTGLSRVWS